MMSSLRVLAMLMALALACCSVRAQIYETLCRDANCTDVALGPLALLPQCYRTPDQGSIRLSFSKTDINVLELCFYSTDDCPSPNATGTTSNDSAATTATTCHAFVNGRPGACPFLHGMNGSLLYVVFSWDADNIKLLQDLIELMPSHHPDPERAKRQILNNFFGLTEFGNWCGAGHGGTRDCCNDGKCSQCNYSQGLTAACLRQCPARDQLDLACAVHDFCTTNYDYETVLPAGSDFSCSSLLGVQQAEYCACDCQLVRSARRATNTNSFYRSSVIFLFTHVTSCWYQSTTGPVCNRGDNRILVTEFCR